MKILRNKTWYGLQTRLSELEIQVSSLKDELNKVGVRRGKNGRYISTKKK